MGWTTKDIPAQAGRLAVVTGATGGLGFEIAAALAAADAQVVIASRDGAKGAAALARLHGRAPPGAVRFEPLDLADLASVRAFADRLLEAGRPLHLLVNNAGVMGAPKRRTTMEGLEETFAVNHLGHFARPAGCCRCCGVRPGGRGWWPSPASPTRRGGSTSPTSRAVAMRS